MNHTPAGLNGDSSRHWRWGLAIWLLVCGTLAATHYGLFFGHPWHEHYDYAVNALQIEQAKTGREIYGNYSRFGFYHPGPAFYYVYAAAETVLCDWLHVLPSPYNAHALAGLLLQGFFFAAALTIADGWIRRPLWMPLALLAAAIHFGFAGSAFIDTWPPRVLLMPFLCFLVASSSTAAGRVGHLPLAVLSGCFLVHGHVAQPLFVVPLFIGAFALMWRNLRRSGCEGESSQRSRTLAHALALGCIALFLVPIAIDLASGSQSNFARILEVMEVTDGLRKSWWKGLLYLCAFFGYVREPEKFLPENGPGRADFISQNPGPYLVWVGLLAAVVFYLVRVFRSANTPERSFVLTFAAVVICACGLSLCWGVAQIGPMYQYNGYFYFAILYAILLLLCAAISSIPFPGARYIGAVACVAAGLIVWDGRHAPLHIDYATNEIVSAVADALRADPSPFAPKYLLFEHTEWGDAVSMALALKRAGSSFRANRDWGPKFARDSAFEPVPPNFEVRDMSTWRLSRRGPAAEGVRIRDNLRVYFDPLPLDPAKAVIDCGEGGNLNLYSLVGFDSPVGHGVWTIRQHAALIFASAPVANDIVVTITAEPFAIPGDKAAQPGTLYVNGREVFEWTLTAHDTVSARVSAEIWNLKSPVTIVLHLPKAIYPPRALASDPRAVAWRIERISFASAK